ncbi:MAG TPA: VOC family protein [Anaerolineales bacterium]|nr:VOC family protein [Anaerolineales bacterium]
MDIHLAVVSLWAEDIPAAVRFYRDVLGLPLLPHHADRPHFRVDGCLLAILPGRPALPPDPEPRFPVVTFSVPDLDAAAETLRRNGIDLPWGTEANPTGRWAMVHDPAGNLIELVQWTA